MRRSHWQQKLVKIGLIVMDANRSQEQWIAPHVQLMNGGKLHLEFDLCDKQLIKKRGKPRFFVILLWYNNKFCDIIFA
jgi:hypothetical protein